jgi:hypothetical protein
MFRCLDVSANRRSMRFGNPLSSLLPSASGNVTQQAGSVGNAADFKRVWDSDCPKLLPGTFGDMSSLRAHPFPSWSFPIHQWIIILFCTLYNQGHSQRHTHAHPHTCILARTQAYILLLLTVMMEVLRSSETSVHARVTRHNNPEYGILHSHRRENLKSYIALTGWAL